MHFDNSTTKADVSLNVYVVCGLMDTNPKILNMNIIILINEYHLFSTGYYTRELVLPHHSIPSFLKAYCPIHFRMPLACLHKWHCSVSFSKLMDRSLHLYTGSIFFSQLYRHVSYLT